MQFGTRARALKAWAPLLPFAAWMLLFLGIPAVAVAIGAFEKSTGSGLTMANVNTATTGVYLLGSRTR